MAIETHPKTGRHVVSNVRDGTAFFAYFGASPDIGAADGCAWFPSDIDCATQFDTVEAAAAAIRLRRLPESLATVS